ncbi:hypothetical protein WDW86_12815 [Bdellovibrionota bacterium FG-2]
MRWFRFLGSLVLLCASFQSVALPIHSAQHFRHDQPDAQGSLVSSACDICLCADMKTAGVFITVVNKVWLPFVARVEIAKIFGISSQPLFLSSIRAPPVSA